MSRNRFRRAHALSPFTQGPGTQGCRQFPRLRCRGEGCQPTHNQPRLAEMDGRISACRRWRDFPSGSITGEPVVHRKFRANHWLQLWSKAIRGTPLVAEAILFRREPRCEEAADWRLRMDASIENSNHFAGLQRPSTCSHWSARIQYSANWAQRSHHFRAEPIGSNQRRQRKWKEEKIH